MLELILFIPSWQLLQSVPLNIIGCYAINANTRDSEKQYCADEMNGVVSGGWPGDGRTQSPSRNKYLFFPQSVITMIFWQVAVVVDTHDETRPF